MKNLHKILLFAVLLSAGNLEARKQAGLAVPQQESSSWIGSLAKGVWGSVTGLFGSNEAASTMGTILPVAGAVAASAILPFGIGTILKIAAPYAIGAAAKMLTDKVTGRDAEKEKRELMIKEVARRVARQMYSPRRSRSRSRRPRSMPRRYEYDEYDEEFSTDDYGYDY